jgi:hypothetical protein
MYVNGSKEYIDCYEDKEQIYNKASELRGKLPFTIDDRTKYTYPDEPLSIPEHKMPIFNCRINSLIEVVMETKFFGEHMMTEKTFNPISLGKPFIVMSSANLLQSIRKIGFKTFSPYIDESYDKIEDNAARLRAIVNEIERIRKFRQDDPKGFKEWYKELQVIAQYNLELITLIGIKQGNHCDDYNRWIRFMHVGI